MQKMKPVSFFHIGPQKSATTWVYKCLKEHPEVACPPKDTIHYFDMFYSKGRKWYANFFKDASPNQKLFDPTASYIRSPWAPRRIVRENEQAKIVLCLRNPVDRAFSHYWHEKEKRKIAFQFKEVLENYDLFSSWIEPGFYAEYIERYLRYFPRDQILCLKFDDLKKNSQLFLRRLLRFLEIDDSFTPSWVNKKANTAGSERTIPNVLWRRVRARLQRIGKRDIVNAVEMSPILGNLVWDQDEYKRGIDDDLRCELQEICEPEIQRLEELLDINLAHWRT